MGVTRFDVVLWGVVGVAALGMLAALGRVAQLQASPDPRLAEHIGDRRTRIELAARRGELLDRRGRVVASEREQYRAVVDPEAFPEKELHESIVKLADAMGVESEAVGLRVLSARAENAQRRAALIAAGLLEDEAQVAATKKEAARQRLIQRLRALVGGEQASLAPAAAPGVDAAGEAVSAGTDGSGSAAAGSDGGASPAEGAPPAPKRIIRYVPLDAELSPERAEAVRQLRIPGVWLERRPKRSLVGGRGLSAVVGKLGYEGVGVTGMERVLDSWLHGTPGQVKYVRDLAGRPLWVEPGAVRAPEHGQSVRLSVDLELQRIAVEELERGMAWADSAGGRIVVMDPLSGEVLAMADLIRPVQAEPFPWFDPASLPREQWPRGVDTGKRYRVFPEDAGRAREPAMARNRCVQDIYEPGSTFKTFVWARAAELGFCPEGEVISKGPGYVMTRSGRSIEDVNSPQTMTWNDVLSHSSNIGMVKLSERMSFAQMQDVPARFGFGKVTGIELQGEEPGLVTPKGSWQQMTQESVSFGHEVAVTPVQLVRAFSAFARNGEASGTLPPTTVLAWGDRGVVATSDRLVKPEIVQRVRTALSATVERMDFNARARMKDDYPKATYTLFGKSGTAQVPVKQTRSESQKGLRAPLGAEGYLKNQYISSFVAAGPIDEPRLVVLVIIDDPGPHLRPIRAHYGSGCAGPVVRRFMERALRYLGVPPEVQAEATQGERAGATPERARR